jgi:hypothetical protein
MTATPTFRIISSTSFRSTRRTSIARPSTTFDAHRGDPRQEEAAHRIAWAAVKRSYVKTEAGWAKR